MSFCFTSTFHLQSPSEPNGVAAKKKNRTVLGFRNDHTLYYHKDSSLSTSSDRVKCVFICVFLNFKLKLQKSFWHNAIFSFSAPVFCFVFCRCWVFVFVFFLHLMFITHGLIVVDSNATRVYSCVQSLVMVSYARAFVASECVREGGISKLLHKWVPFHT